MKRKILYTATVVKTHINEFHIPYMKLLKENGEIVCVAAKNDFGKEKIEIPYCDHFYEIPFNRNPFSTENIIAYKMLVNLINREEFDIIHCHTPVASAITRLAARKARKKGTAVIYTAHGFHFYKGAPILNWLIYYPIELICSLWTDVIITINNEDFNRAKKMFFKKCEIIPGIGIDCNKYEDVNIDKKRLRSEFGIPEKSFVICSVGELNTNKNHEVIIKAIKNIKDEDICYIIAGQGEKEQYLRHLIEKLDLQKQVKLLGYRYDIPELYALSDICCFPSIREGMGLAALEGMASGLALLCADNRGTRCYAENGKNSIVCESNNVESFMNGIAFLKNNPEIAKLYGKNGREKAKEFSIDKVIQKMKIVYEINI